MASSHKAYHLLLSKSGQTYKGTGLARSSSVSPVQLIRNDHALIDMQHREQTKSCHCRPCQDHCFNKGFGTLATAGFLQPKGQLRAALYVFLAATVWLQGDKSWLTAMLFVSYSCALSMPMSPGLLITCALCTQSAHRLSPTRRHPQATLTYPIDVPITVNLHWVLSCWARPCYFS